MILKKIRPTLAIIMVFASSYSFAGTEDWNGKFKINFGSQTVEASHTPQKIQFLFFSAGKCMNLKKGTRINGVEIKEDVSLCTENSIPKFSQELQKLGAILSQDVKRGSTYQD